MGMSINGANRRWVKVERRVSAEGTTIKYRLEGTPYSVESRTRHIPHANREGTWDHTMYAVLYDGAELAEKYTLGLAKEYVEALIDAGEAD